MFLITRTACCCIRQQKTHQQPAPGLDEHFDMAHRLVSAPGQFQSDVHSLACVGLAAIGLQGDAGGGCIADDSHQLAPLLELILLMHIHLQA